MEENNEIKHNVAQTYAEDMARAIEDDKEEGIIKKIIHEEEEREIKKKNRSPETIKNKFFMVVSVLFIVFGFIILFYFLFSKNDSVVNVAKQFTPLIFSDQNSFFEVKGFKNDEITQTVSNEVIKTGVKNGGVEAIYLTEDKAVLGLRRFVSLSNGNFIPSNNALLVSDNFLMGVVNTDTKDFFILLKMNSTADIFDSLRTWENKMFFDLHGFFGIDITSANKYLLNANFSDGIIENKNARILYDSNNNIVMMYIFADDNSVIITDTESAAHEIMLRLAASRIKK